ncbi:MAG TPA: SGNH/GDSL hydrolase family protein, partial [Metabacillus sp.]|nr:SGNH/GDSL hydrolase family protein [Metabacillus sp.]
ICHTGNINNYHFKYTCSIGKTMKRKWSYTATADKVGTYTMTVTVYNSNLQVVKTGTITIKVVNKTTDISTAKNVLCIGDSLTNDKAWLNEWKSLADAMFGTGKMQFIGTRGTAPYKLEGRSGWSARTYATNYMEQIILNVTGVTVMPTSKKVYSLPDSYGGHNWAVETTNITNGSGTITFNRLDSTDYVVSSSGTITAVDGAGSGDSSITYSSWTPASNNPLWNQSTNQLDFNNYLTVNGFTKPDIVQIFLGANDVPYWTGDFTSVTASMQTRFGWLKTIVDTILSQWSGTKVYVVLTPFYADQNGLGANYGNQYIDNQLHMNVFTWCYNLIQQYKDYNSNVSIVPVAQTMDSDYDYIPASQSVNPRSSLTETVQTGGVHPSNEGYYQMADTMFSHFVGHYLDA